MRSFLILSIVFMVALSGQESWQSKIVYFAGDELIYVRDSIGNRIPDFSYAGYRNSDENIPYIPVVASIQPDSGDNTAKIQTAINGMAAFPLNENGFRGALLLGPGTYEIWGTIRLNVSGVVLRGSGDGDNEQSNTILRARGDSPHQRSVLVSGGGDDSKWQDVADWNNAFINIVDDTVLVNEKSFTVENASSLAVGDNIIIYHPCTNAWLAAIDYGGTHSGESGAEDVDIPWTVGAYPIVFNRNITSISGKTITVDVPIYTTLVKALSQSYIYKYARNGLKTNIGVENIRIDIETSSYYDEKHAWTAFDFWQIEDAWARNCTALHFGLSGFRTNTATRVTIENCRALDPNSVIDGGRRYNFNVYTASQQILFTHCQATNGRHHYMSNGTSLTSGVVFHRCTSSGAYASSEGHRQWTQAMLYDNAVEIDGPRPGYNPRLLGLYNRGYYGTSHGWAAIHCVAWNCNVNNGYLIVQQPPTGQNYAIGCFGANITGNHPPASFDEREGYIEGSNKPGLYPESLFESQFHIRTGSYVSIPLVSEKSQKIEGFKLINNFPDPFNLRTTLRYEVATRQNFEINIYDISGRKVKHIFKGIRDPGRYDLYWDGYTIGGEIAASGLYFCVFKTNKYTKSEKMVLIK